MNAIAIALALAATPAAAPAGEPAGPPPSAAAADAAFRALYGREWAWRQAEFGRIDEEEGEGAANLHLPHVDPASQARRLAYWEEVLRALSAIDPAALSPADQVDYAVYRIQIGNLAEDQRLRTYEAPFNSDSSFWADLVPGSGRPYRTTAQYRAYLSRLAEIPRYFDEEIGEMRAGLKRGFTVPRATLTGRDQSIAAVAEAATPEATPFWAPFRSFPPGVAPAERAALEAEARKVIAGAVIPAHRTLLAFMRGDYFPGARASLAAEDLPDGARFYRQMIREYVTLDLEPEEIHRRGLEDVARIRTEMAAAMRATGFKGELPAFLAFLRSDPRFYAKTPEELLGRAALIAKRGDAKLAQYFGRLPRGRFTIVPVPDNIAPYYTSGRGGAHVYLLNTYDLPHRPLYQLTALTLHEAELGHGLQGEIAEEQKAQPPFRRHTYISAYGEGWALYTEKLGKEMGLYETPYDDFGRLSYEMWRACRLVVDTGIHHARWTRARAIAYLAENTALPLHEIETEVDRYISWPGQALSYKLGMMDIERLRARAEAALGPKFDIRAFHDAVLATGSVPLPVLDARIEAFIAGGGADPVEPLRP